MEDIGHLNQAIKNGRTRELILVAEALHNQHITGIAADIAARHKEGVRLVLIAGPSSSGKTTFSKRLAVQLLAQGIKPYPLAMDHYFVDRDDTPLDEHGEFNFEALEALNRPVLNEQLLALMRGERVNIPHFDFISGKSVPGEEVQLTPDHVLIVEGIHGLNPALVPAVPPETIYRIYTSALTQLNIDRHNRVPTTDVRILRRIVRDATYRGYSALDTLERWSSVRRGEKALHLPLPGERRRDVQLGPGLRAGRAASTGGAAAAPDRAQFGPLHRGQAAALLPALGAADAHPAGQEHPRHLAAARVRRRLDPAHLHARRRPAHDRRGRRPRRQRLRINQGGPLDRPAVSGLTATHSIGISAPVRMSHRWRVS